MGKINRGLFAVLSVVGVLSLTRGAWADDTILFVSDRDEKANWDIYSMNPDGTGIQRLSDAASIENHPSLSPDGTTVVFSSDATGNFEIYTAPLASMSDEASWVQLTDNECLVTIGTCIPARHPHWSPDGNEIIYTTKDGCCPTTELYVSNCSVPIAITDPCGERYERIHVMNSDGSNNRAINLFESPGECSSPSIFHAGHPSFHPGGTKILFTGAVNKDGTDWEVFVADWDGTSASNVTQVTEGSSYSAGNPNPVQMSGGAHFDGDGSDIYFSSTRTWKGNSQIFRISSWETQSLPLPVSDDLRLTWHCGNDYVPEPLSGSGGLASLVVKNGGGTDGEVAYVSDATASWDNPQDLDIWVMNPDGSGRTNLTESATSPEMMLIADEVSWFCGLPRNLSPCTFVPRAVSLESKSLMLQAETQLPEDFPNRDKYPFYMNEAGSYMEANYSDYLQQITSLLDQYWMGETELGTRQIVIPSMMPDVGPGTWCEDCVLCNECVVIDTTCSPSEGTVGQSYSHTLTLSANKTVTWSLSGLPAGLSFNSVTGEISGTPIEAGTSNLLLIASTAEGNADSLDCSLTVSEEGGGGDGGGEGDTGGGEGDTGGGCSLIRR